ncbi:MAG: hypothetical protein CSA95_03690 [Bacteroidetes bacterium]|nr:MAG: hypothetical protein CSA95_03690 [Bacteroidota bacterium]
MVLFFCFFVVFGVVASGFLITNGLTHEYSVESGMVYRGSIQMENLTKSVRRVKVYMRDYRFYAAGEVFYDDPEEELNPRSNVGWIHFASNFITLSPGSKGQLQYEIRVPDTLTRGGTFWSMVMVEGVDIEAFEKPVEGEVQVRSLIRYGVQIVTHVGSEGKKDLVFDNFALSYDEEAHTPLLSFDLLNTGTLLLRPELKVELFDGKGASVALVEAESPRIYPQLSVRNSLPLNGVTSGTYKAFILVDTSDDEVFATEVNLEIKDK